MAKPKPVTGVTPVAKLMWPFLTEPRKPEDDDDKPTYEVEVELDPKNKDHMKFKAQIEGYLDEDEKSPIKKQKGKDKKKTGMECVKFKTGFEPVICDSKRNELVLAEGETIGNGSEGRISWQLHHYDYKGQQGINLYLKGAQITKLVTFSNGDTAEGCGFQEEEGYVSDFEDKMADFIDGPQEATADESDNTPF